MSENIKVTHSNTNGLFTSAIGTLAENIQQDGIDPMYKVFKEDHISEIKTSDKNDEVSPTLKKAINILKDLIIEIEMLNQDTAEEQGAILKSIGNTGNVHCEVATRSKLFGLNETVQAASAEGNVNSQIQELNAMIDQFSKRYTLKRTKTHPLPYSEKIGETEISRVKQTRKLEMIIYKKAVKVNESVLIGDC